MLDSQDVCMNAPASAALSAQPQPYLEVLALPTLRLRNAPSAASHSVDSSLLD